MKDKDKRQKSSNYSETPPFTPSIKLREIAGLPIEEHQNCQYKVESRDVRLRVWNIINPPSSPKTYPVKDVYHAMRLIDALADSQLLIPEIGCNAFGLEIFRDGEWEEWEDEHGNSVSELRRENE